MSLNPYLSAFVRHFETMSGTDSVVSREDVSRLSVQKETVAEQSAAIVRRLEGLAAPDKFVLEEAFLYELLGLLVRFDAHVRYVERARRDHDVSPSPTSLHDAIVDNANEVVSLLKTFFGETAGADDNAQRVAVRMLTGQDHMFDFQAQS